MVRLEVSVLCFLKLCDVLRIFFLFCKLSPLFAQTVQVVMWKGVELGWLSLLKCFCSVCLRGRPVRFSKTGAKISTVEQFISLLLEHDGFGRCPLPGRDLFLLFLNITVSFDSDLERFIVGWMVCQALSEYAEERDTLALSCRLIRDAIGACNEEKSVTVAGGNTSGTSPSEEGTEHKFSRGCREAEAAHNSSTSCGHTFLPEESDTDATAAQQRFCFERASKPVVTEEVYLPLDQTLQVSTLCTFCARSSKMQRPIRIMCMKSLDADIDMADFRKIIRKSRAQLILFQHVISEEVQEILFQSNVFYIDRIGKHLVSLISQNLKWRFPESSCERTLLSLGFIDVDCYLGDVTFRRKGRRIDIVLRNTGTATRAPTEKCSISSLCRSMRAQDGSQATYLHFVQVLRLRCQGATHKMVRSNLPIAFFLLIVGGGGRTALRSCLYDALTAWEHGRFFALLELLCRLH